MVTIVHSQTGTSRRAGIVRRAPLWMHCAGLAVVLLVVLPLTKPGVAYTSDEGASIVQARLLEDTGSWLQHDTLARFDPAAKARPFPHGDVGTKGRAPYVRHPLYPLVLAAVDEVAGTAGLYLLGVAGTVLAALAAGFLMRRVRPGLEPLALWVVGVASPLFFDSFIVLAHTVAAAAVAFAVLCAVRAWDEGRSRRGWDVVGVALLTALASALRTEAAFLAGGVAAGAALAAWRSPAVRARALAVGAATIVAVAFVRVLEHLVAVHVLGGAVSSGEPGQSSGPILSGRWHGFLATWLTPGYRRSGGGEAALVAAVLLVAIAVVFARRGGSDSICRGLLVAAGLLYLLRLVVGPVESVPGLVMAFPIGWAGAWLVGRRDVTGAGGILLLVAAVVAAGVLATEYSIGGGVEWGGRYFAIAIPIAVPALVAAQARVQSVDIRQALVAFGVVASVSLCVIAVQSLRHTHAATRLLLAGVGNGATQAGPPGGGLDSRPVVVSTERLLPQIAWDRYNRYQWGAPETAELAPFVHRLAEGGVQRFVLVSADPQRQLAEIAGDYVEVGRPEVGGAPAPVPVVVVQRR
jgi:hypothetical protein